MDANTRPTHEEQMKPKRTMRMRVAVRTMGMTALLAGLAVGEVVAQRPVPASAPTLKTPMVATPAGPAPTNVIVDGTPATARLRWDRLGGVTGYTVARAAGMGQPWVGLTPSPLLAESFADAGLDPRVTYVYRVTAVYADGRLGNTDVTFTPPAPVNPTGFTAKQTGNGQVQLSWQPVSGAGYYAVFGPGSANGGVRLNGVTSYTVTGVPPGAQEWSVGSYYEPGPISSPAGAFPRAYLTVTAPPVSGRYLVTITGLRAIWASFDDQLSRDGMGDEVYAAAYTRRYDRRTGAIAEVTNRKTLTYGDTKGFGTNRIQAGTRSGTGGIRDSDPIPANSDPAQRSFPPSDIAFPLKVFEGTLTDGVDALVISPSLWEEDGFNQQYLNWDQQMASITPSLFSRPEIQNQITGGRFGQLLFGTSLLKDGTADAAHFVVSLFSGVAMVGQQAKLALEGGTDRAIGILRSGTNDLVVPNAMVVLTREIIEAGLAPLPPGTPLVGLPIAWPRVPKPGVIMVPFVDGTHYVGVVAITPARYELYLSVERLP